MYLQCLECIVAGFHIKLINVVYLVVVFEPCQQKESKKLNVFTL